MRQRGPSRHCSPPHIQPTRAALCYIIYVTDDDRFPPCDTLTDILRLIGSLCSSRDVDPNCRGYVRSLATFSSYVYYWLFKYPRVHHSSQLRFDNYRVVNHESLDAIIKIDKIDVGWNLTEGGDLEAAPFHSTGERDGIYRLNFTGSKNFAKPRNFSSEVYKNALVQWSSLGIGESKSLDGSRKRNCGIVSHKFTSPRRNRTKDEHCDIDTKVRERSLEDRLSVVGLFVNGSPVVVGERRVGGGQRILVPRILSVELIFETFEPPV